MSTLCHLLVFIFLENTVWAQVTDSTNRRPLSVRDQVDVVDVAHRLLPHWKRFVPHDSAMLNEGGKIVWVIPQVGYTLQTDFLAQVLGNVAFQRPGANISTVVGAVTYTLNNQALLSLTTAIWSRQNQLYWIGDWRVMHYPQSTFGLGIVNTSLNREISMDYEYLRFYQTVLKRLGPNLYGGLGYALDLHWAISSYNRNREVIQISRYREGVEGRSISSGPVLRLLYDNRVNAINPLGGFYASVQYRTNLKFLGSDQNYQALLIESRKYLKLSSRSNNVLAFWSYNVLTMNGNPPFLDLPSTGWDTYSNTGRGYIQGRYRGKNLLYLETEYRFGLTRNRLLGGVIFTNAQTTTEVIDGRFHRVAPAAGAGLRLSLNKISRTNLSVDYAFGVNGSHGLFFNFGEVF